MNKNPILPLLPLLLLTAATPAPPIPAPESAPVGRAVNAFAYDLYAQLAPAEGNLFFSPFSLSTALGMTYTGARGLTFHEMTNVLHVWDTRPFGYKMSPEGIIREHSAAYASFLRAVNAGDPKTRDYDLASANALWGQQDYTFVPAFLANLRDNFGAHFQTLDFANPEPARLTINQWVEKQTYDKIQDLIAKGILGRDTVLVLTNAIYFKGQWASRFDPKRTADGPFTLADGKTVQARLMNQTADARYLQADNVQILELFYAAAPHPAATQPTTDSSADLSMVLLLPATPAALPGLEKSLTRENLNFWLSQLRPQKVQVTIPSFKLTSQFDLEKPLAALGMPSAFDPGKADFSGIAAQKGLFISKVLHKAFVDVNEEGTEAAAATAVIIERRVSAPPPPIFRADRPFVFLIRHLPTDTILFLGRVSDPTR